MGASRSIWIAPSGGVHALVSQALDLYHVRSEDSMPEGGFAEVAFHKTLLGGFRNGVTWATDQTIRDVNIRENCAPTLKIFDKNGVQLVFVGRPKIQWQAREPLARALENLTTLPWEANDGCFIITPEHEQAQSNDDDDGSSSSSSSAEAPAVEEDIKP